MRLSDAIDRARAANACDEAIADLAGCASWAEVAGHERVDAWLKWAVRHGIFPASQAVKKYQAVEKHAWAVYEAVRQPAWAEYEAVEKPAWAVYQAVEQPAWAEYKAVVQHAWAEYEAVVQPAWAKYEAVQKHAWAEYEAVRSHVWAEYKAVEQPARAVLKTELLAELTGSAIILARDYDVFVAAKK
jgi:hypothetical protein